MLFFLLVLIFSLHLACMNLASSGLIVASLAECFSGAPRDRAAQFASRLAGYTILSLLLGAILGGLLLLFFWSASYQDLLLRRLYSRVFFGALEIAFTLLLSLIYWRWAANSSTGAWRYTRGLLALIASTNLLYHFPTLFAIVADAAPTSTSDSPLIGRKEMHAFLLSGPILSHAVHFLLASLAFSGVFAAYLTGREPDALSAFHFRRLGAALALACTVLQIPVGIAVYTTLPGPAQRALLGDNLLLSLTFLASLGSAFWLVQLLLGQLSPETPPTRSTWSLAAMLLTIFLMSAMLWGTRLERLPQAAKTISFSLTPIKINRPPKPPAPRNHEEMPDRMKVIPS